mmetsp:Transcript_54852/g.158676  ORF Transcript_54852/g.158676 Transcript_54852/m.158676 type:complete len:265 (-) Transcript_54852:117-911(-)
MGSKGDDEFGGGHVKWGEEEPEEKKARLEEMFMVPGEVTSRRKKKTSKEDVQQAKEEYISLDWDDIFPKKPKERLRWLYKAILGAKEGRIKPAPLYDIIAHRKFVDGLKGSIATDTLNLIRGHLYLFSPKQQKQLTSNNFELFRKYAPINVLDSDEDEADAPPLPPPPEVVVELKDKKKRNQVDEERRRREEREREEEEAAMGSDEDVDTKRRRILAKGIERRVDPSDGQAYTLEEFIAEYGGRADKPPVEWDNAHHTSFIFKS